ncbi:MAG: hypothetical protein A2X13_06315 [Bacteroidetes bacterium GWC2_33_15]|nr:MAG: hypothetical protein A2X10_13430 [Bacteroidetes bacterium GWA2_33_15]OFX49279.1 MAG: hypothetical protein A2X13_06315 [Bacteroidetes bacterium GWC2_33_15]OFX65456.1 MAG: hypothetical protein A2X15_00375 [Bacteroidetes bacterium GWB2_32_14]OFX69572.1 MAG: hypothetical protein A2X14_01930 [Bacteroidetes bacterium GWD2_33_33]
MNFSNEELFSMYGQNDKFVRLEFHHESESFDKFGVSLMGTFKYIQAERDSLLQILSQEQIPRTEKKVLFIPSELENLTKTQIEDLDRNGILCSDINVVYASNLPSSNRYSIKDKKDIPNTINIEIDGRDWQDLNQITYGFLKSRYSKDKNLSPSELNQYFGLRTYYKDNITDVEYISCVFDLQGKLKNEIRLQELKAKFFDAQISEDEMLDFIILISEELKKHDKIIKAEIQKTNQKLSDLAEKYGDKIENLEKICSNYEERVVLFGDKLVYLDFERFVHIYARHVSETLISDKYIGKTVFQYKFDDIMRLISLVLGSASNDIQQHFKENPDKQYRRMGTRSVYFDGHYYRIEIDEKGRLITFHPYNNNEEKENDEEK